MPFRLPISNKPFYRKNKVDWGTTQCNYCFKEFKKNSYHHHHCSKKCYSKLSYNRKRKNMFNRKYYHLNKYFINFKKGLKRKENPELYRERQRKWRKKNRELHNKYVSNWRKKNRERYNEIKRDYYKRNKENISEQKKLKYKEKNYR